MDFSFNSLLAQIRRWMQSGSPPVVAGLVGFLEASFVFINLEPLIIPMMAARKRGIWLLAACCVAGNLLACVVMYSLGAFLAEPVIDPFIQFINAEEVYAAAQAHLREADLATLFLINISPFPTQIETAAAGAIAYPFWPYLLAFFLARSVRYAVLALVVRIIGLRASDFVEKYQAEIFLAGIALTCALGLFLFLR